MYAVEFETYVTGNVIYLPQKYEGLSGKKLRVIALIEEEKTTPKLEFKAIKIKTKNFKFDRDEANAR